MSAYLGLGFARGLREYDANKQVEEDRTRARAIEDKRMAREDVQFQQGQEDRAFGMPLQRRSMERQDRVQGMQAEQLEKDNEFKNLERLHRDGLRRMLQSQGADLEGLRQWSNAYPGSHGIDFVRNQDGSFSVIDPDGKEAHRARNVDELGTLTFAAMDPQAYFKTKIEASKPQKGRFAESGRGVLDTATGKFSPHGPGMSRDGKPKAVRYPQRGMVLDAKALIAGVPELSALSSQDQEAIAFNVSARAQALLTEQPGIDAAAATSMALDEELRNITPGEQRSAFGMDWLAPDKKPAYRDRRKIGAASGAPTQEPTQPARIQSDADYSRLPSGALFVGPDGVLRRKPADAATYVMPNGRKVTMREIEATATNRGVSPEQVVRDLGLR